MKKEIDHEVETIKSKIAALVRKERFILTNSILVFCHFFAGFACELDKSLAAILRANTW